MPGSIAVYFVNHDQLDPAVRKGLAGAGCEIAVVRTIAEAIGALSLAKQDDGPGHVVILVAEVQAGAIPLLTLLDERDVDLPPAVLLDRDGGDIRAVIDALKHHVADYLLVSDHEFQREIRVRILAERAILEKRLARGNGAEAAASAKPRTPSLVIMPGFHWDPNIHVIYVGGGYLRLSPVEGRVFDLLISHHNCTVPVRELIAHALSCSSVDVSHGVRLLRPHMMRLRHKLEQHPELAHRIVNMRGSGYMFITPA